MRLESKVGKINSAREDIYNFLIDFDNFKQLIPQDKVSNWQSDENSCRFTVSPVGETGVQIVEKEAPKLIKLSSIDKSQYDFIFWVQLKPTEEPGTTYLKLTMEVELNAMMQMMAKKPLKQFLDKLVEQLEAFQFPASS